MPPSPIESRILSLLARRADAQLARAGQLVAQARRNACAASSELEAARRELAGLDLKIADGLTALACRLAQSARSAELMNRNDFMRHEYARTQLMACRSSACAAVGAAEKHLDATRAALAETQEAQRASARRREKYRLAERLLSEEGTDDADGSSLPAPSPILAIRSTPPMQGP